MPKYQQMRYAVFFKDWGAAQDTIIMFIVVAETTGQARNKARRLLRSGYPSNNATIKRTMKLGPATDVVVESEG